MEPEEETPPPAPTTTTTSDITVDSAPPPRSQLYDILNFHVSPPKRNVNVHSLSSDERKQLFTHWAKYNVENWYEDLEEFTFKTRFFDLPKQDAVKLSSGPIRDLSNIDWSEFKELEEKIDSTIAEMNCKTGVFVRLSTRSPKDAILLDDDLLERHVVQYWADNITNWTDMNQVNIQLWQGMANSMKVTSGREAISLFLRSSRVSEDCKRDLEREEYYQMSVIVREWVNISIDYEFRTFITDRKINAISQYFNNCFFPKVLSNKQHILDQINQLWQSASHKTKWDTGTVDFVLNNDLSKVWIIECNPLDMLTGGAMFNYFVDWEVVVGKKELEFRVIENVDCLEQEFEGTISTFGPEMKRATAIQQKREEEKQKQKQKEQEVDRCQVM